MKTFLRALLMLGGIALAAAGELPKVMVLEQEFTLVVVVTREAYTLNEYVPTGETARGWTRKVTVMHAPNTSEPSLAMISLMRATQKNEELASRSAVVGREGVKEGDDIAVLLIFKDAGSGGMEYNLQRFAKEPGVAGVMSYQYARHYPADSASQPKRGEIKTWLEALWALSAPVHAKLEK